MRNKWKLLIPVFILAALAGAFLLYAGSYYHADASALAALASDEGVSVTSTDYGWLFDGPSETDALIFYPGAKVEEAAYAPLLHRLAAQGMDVCLVRMPYRLAFFGISKASVLMDQYDYPHWYIGGHSLGGAMAARYAAGHADRLTGVILLAAYPTKALDSTLSVVTLYGSEDGVLNRSKLEAGRGYLPESARETVIEGGNHAQFGNYGPQAGDGQAAISGLEQQRLTVEEILQNVFVTEEKDASVLSPAGAV